MCGISGVFSSPTGPNYEAVIRDIVRNQFQRGPDAQAVETVSPSSPQVILGHNRLSIIDLTAASNQPLWDHDRRICVVFNGELYNYLELKEELRAKGHQFATAGDSEVLIEAFKAWGIGAVQRCIGMFAFALWDSIAKELWLVRDRFGVKPLYFHQAKDSLLFASTPTVLGAALKLAPNLDYLLDGIELKMYERDGPHSPFHDLHALPAGTWLKATQHQSGGITCATGRYYDLEACVAARRAALLERSDTEWVEEVRACLESSLDLRLRSDVPVGLSLSGGIDSSTIAALTAKRYGNITAFSFGSPEDQFSEGVRVAEIASMTGIKVHYCRPTLKDINTATWNTLAAQGAPFPTGSIVAQNLVFKAAREHGVVVLLGGQGADEALMGYHKFKVFLLQQAWRNRHYGRMLSLAGGILALIGAELDSITDYWHERHRFKRSQPRSSTLLRRDNPAVQMQGLAPQTAVWQRQLLDITRFSLPTLLRYEDRNSMGNSIESRLPFMDHRFVELGLALPDAVKVRHGYGKWILREIARDQIPESIRMTRKKRGFDVDHHAWITNGLGAELRAKLTSSRAGYDAFLVRPIDIDIDFSDRRLIEDPLAYAEVMTLIWLHDSRQTGRPV